MSHWKYTNAQGFHVFIAVVCDRELGLYDKAAQCITEPQMVVGCPEHHMVVVTHAEYWRSRNPGCNPDHTDRCRLK